MDREQPGGQCVVWKTTSSATLVPTPVLWPDRLGAFSRRPCNRNSQENDIRPEKSTPNIVQEGNEAIEQLGNWWVDQAEIGGSHTARGRQAWLVFGSDHLKKAVAVEPLWVGSWSQHVQPTEYDTCFAPRGVEFDYVVVRGS